MNFQGISIIVPVYNVEKYLPKCIESILKQTFIAFELLLIDDGSTDNSGKICDEYATIDKRVKVYHLSNSGVSAARNVGIKNSTGTHITFIDSDDWIEPDYLKLFDTYLNEYKFDLLVSGYCTDYLLDNKQIGSVLSAGKVHVNEDKSLIIAELFENKFLSMVWGKVFRRDLIIDNNLFFDTTISFGEDTLFSWSYLLQINSIGINDYIGYHYMQYAGSSLTTKMDSHENIMYINSKTYEMKKSVSEKYNLTSNFSFNRIIELEYIMMAIRANSSMYVAGFKKNRSFRYQKWTELANNINLFQLPASSLFMRILKIFLLNKQIFFLDMVMIFRNWIIR